MDQDKKRRGFSLLPLRIAVLLLACAAAVTLLIWRGRIGEKREELNDLNEQISIQDTRNEAAREVLGTLDTEDGLKDYAERKARDELNYARPGERVFVDVGG